MEQLIANLAPLSMHMGATGYFVTEGISKTFARRSKQLVIEMIETSQKRFFGPRGIEAFFVYGDECITVAYIGGVPEPLPADWRSGPDTSRSEGNLDAYQYSDSDSDKRKLSKEQRKQQHKKLKLRRKLNKKQQREKKKRKGKSFCCSFYLPLIYTGSSLFSTAIASVPKRQQQPC